MPLIARLAAAAALCALAGCHLLDQRDFDRKAGKRPEPPAPKIALRPGPPPLVVIRYTSADPAYAEGLAAAVKRALAVKPNVLFSVQLREPPAPTPAAQAVALHAAAAAARELAEAITTDGADIGQVEISVRTDPAVTLREADIYVH